MKLTRYSILLLMLAGFEINCYAQEILIQGKIVDKETHEPLPYTTVYIRGTQTGTASNFDGRFMLSVPEKFMDSTLVCSYVGFRDANVTLRIFKPGSEIGMIPDVVELKSVEVKPWSAWDYIQAAMNSIQKNYSQVPFMTEGYYNEYLSENDNFLKYSEGVAETYNPAYGDTTKSHSRLIQARRRNDLGKLQFMHDKIDKRMKKYQEKKDTAATDEPKSVDEAILDASFGGPDRIIGSDPVRDTADYLNAAKKKEFRYTIEGYASYHNENVIIIGYHSKGNIDHQVKEGKVYISLLTNAIVEVSFNYKVVIPVIAQPVLFAMGLGISEPLISGRVHYKPVQDRWYLNDIVVDGSVRLTKKKLFKKNDRSIFKFNLGLINTKFDFTHVHDIPPEQRLIVNKPLEDQVKEDPEFWKNYPAVRPMEE